MPKCLLALFCLCLAGCVSLKPYQHSASPLSPAEKQAVYRQSKVEALALVQVGGRPLFYTDWFKLAAYYRQSGDETAAQWMERWNYLHPMLFGPALVSTVFGLVSGFPFLHSENDKMNFWLSFGFGTLAGAWDLWMRWMYLWPAERHFNAYLQKDLELNLVPQNQGGTLFLSFKY